MENAIFDELQAVERRHEEESKARWAAQLSMVRARQDEFDPEVKIAVHQKRAYQKRKPPASAGPRLSGIDQQVLERIAQLNDIGRTQISVPELANYINCEVRSVQRSISNLETVGYLLRRLQPTSNPRRHRPSILILLDLGWLRLNRIGPAPGLRGSGVTKMSHPSEIKTNNSCTKDEVSAAPAAHSGARATPSAAARHEPERPEATAKSKLTTGETMGGDLANSIKDESAINASTPVEAEKCPVRVAFERLARLAAARLHPSRAPILHVIDHFEAIDAARRQRLSQFNPDAWSRAVAAHGREIVLLAAALALLRPRDGRGRPIRSAASYLGGMLRQPPGALNPIPSLDSMLNGLARMPTGDPGPAGLGR